MDPRGSLGRIVQPLITGLWGCLGLCFLGGLLAGCLDFNFFGFLWCSQYWG